MPNTNWFGPGMAVLVFVCLCVVKGVAAVPEPIVIGGEVDYLPYETINASGEPEGFHVDLMRALSREMNVEVDFQLGSWERMRAGLISGEIHVLGMFVTPERAELVSFADPHVIAHHRIFIPAGADSIGSIDELEGKRVIVQRLAYSHEYLAGSELNVELTLVDDDADGLALLAEGRHDAALLTEHRSRHELRRRNFSNLTISGPPVLPVEYAFAVRRGNQPLLDLINTGLQRVRASGEFDRIYDHWLHPDDEPDSPAGLPWMFAIPAAIVALIILWLMYWLWKAHRNQRQAHEQLDYLRDHDRLTGLLNRHAFERRLHQLLSETAIPDRSHAVLGINIDQFRLINEQMGHAAADRVLASLATAWSGILPEHAVATRISGDEFAVLLPDTELDRATEAGQRLLTAARDFGAEEPTVQRRIGLSIGVVVFRGNEHNVAQILRRADCALLAAKEDGGNRIHVWKRGDRRLAEKLGELRWVGRIESALDENRMIPYWQAIVPAAADSARPGGIEILARLRDEGGDIVAAGVFMPAAERYFLASRIDRHMIDFMLDWMENHPLVANRFETINFNLSGRSLGDERFLAYLEERLNFDDDLIERICLEVTETALIANLNLARGVLERLHRRGCRIALDDFGIGLSSMKYLRELPVDYLKIDGSFVRDIDRNDEAQSMIREINRLGHAMGKITVAENVETEVIRAILTRIGVDYVQGYLVGRPQPLEMLEMDGRRAANHK